jgi:outer membrane protein
MDRRDYKILFYCLLMCLVTGTMVYRLTGNREKKIAVVDAVRLANGFNMKTELEQIEKTKLQHASQQMDSIVNAIRQSRDAGAEQGRNVEASYAYYKSKLQNDYENSNRELNEKVWKRLNPLLVEYGKKSGLHIIVGANGMGSVLYYDSFYDLTDDVIKFVNKRYAEGN